MAEQKQSNTMESFRKWIVDNKLKAVGTLWASSVAGSFAYNWSQPAMKTSVKIIHARLHAQALTLAALAGAAAVEYYDRNYAAGAEGAAGARNKYPSFLHLEAAQPHNTKSG